VSGVRTFDVLITAWDLYGKDIEWSMHIVAPSEAAAKLTARRLFHEDYGGDCSIDRITAKEVKGGVPDRNDENYFGSDL